MADRSGQQLGNYRLVRLLGQGGFAEVYLGEHLHLETQAAIKVLHTQLTAQDGEEFRREARMIARLIHPHIVRVLDFGIEGTTPFLVMDYAPNGTLRQRHPRGSRLTLETVISYVKQIADGLHYAHEQRLIHRDIKPENILVGARNELLLSDFGIALVAQSSRYQSMQDIAGTMAYSAPEQIQGKPRAASDQYALGIMVYEWLSGDRPFRGSFTELVGQHLTVPPPPLRQKVPTLSTELEQVVMTALAKDYPQRFGSVAAFARALEQASQAPLRRAATGVEETVSSRPSSPIVPTLPGREVATNVITPEEQKPPVSAVVPPPVQTPSSPMTPLPVRTPLSAIATPSPVQLTPPKRELARRLSRRAMITGLIVVGVGVVGGGVIWWAVAPQPPYIYRGHSGWVGAVGWSWDGKRIASGGYDQTVQVWNAADGSNVSTYHGHSDVVYAVMWSPDGKQVASASNDSTVQVWDAADGSKVYTYRHDAWVNTVAWSPDGRYIASGSADTTVQVWDVAIGNSVYTYHGHTDSVNAVAWSPDGKQIASGSWDKTVQVWNAVDGSNVSTYSRHSDRVNAVGWSPDGAYIASGSDDSTVQVWNAADGANVYAYRGHHWMVYAVGWSLDGKRIASGSYDQTVQVWNAADGSNVYTYRGHSGTVRAIAWSPDGKRIVSGGDDSTAQIWSPE
ncbi:MAG TPA: serine/threonine-protein kinase [Ktedonobacteraceae bacterium]|jgi:serine/threonine protein kinase|nr:serine/threonine-protein kinase [Ktedonobacteraceae bacterium]